MKFQTEKENILNPLQQIIGAVEKRQTMPSLSHVLLKVTNDNLTLITTDLEIEFVANYAIKIDEPGEISLPARKLLDICKALPNDSIINFSLTNNQAIIRAGKSRFTLSTLPASDFPALDTISTIYSFDISQTLFKSIISKTSFAMAQNDVRYYLNGLMLELSMNSLKAVATDGHRLAYCEKDIEANIPDIRQVILPKKCVLELTRLLADTDEKITVSLASNHIKIQFNQLCLTSKLIDGRFPDYNKAMPTVTDNKIVIDKEEFKQSLIRASILSNEKYHGIRLELSKNLIKLQATNPDNEAADIEQEVDYNGNDIEISFNVNYMLDVLNASSSETLHINLHDSNSSFLINYANLSDCKFVIMPMRL